MERRIVEEELRLLRRHEPFVRVLVVDSTGSVPGKPGAVMIVRADGTTVGTVGGAALEQELKLAAREVLETGQGTLRRFDLARWRPGGLPSLCGGVVHVALEFAAARPSLLLWGGGHVAESLARLLPSLEYDYAVADDRAAWVTAERFPDALQREVVEPSRLWEVFEPAGFSHLYVLGYDASKDSEVLFQSLDRFPNTIGLIASAAKRAHLYQGLRARGVPARAIARIQSPIGLSIGAQRPAEIAVSVVAEIIRSRHPGTRRSGPRAEVAPDAARLR